MQLLAPGIYCYRFDNTKTFLQLAKHSSLYKRGFVNYGKAGNRPTRITSILNPVMLNQEENADVFGALDTLNADLLAIVNQYRLEFDLEELTKETEWLIMRYDEGDYFDTHKDEDPSYDRTVAIVAYLNDDYTGGELEFPDFKLSVKPKAGDALVFPGSFAYRHRVKPITSGVRYAVVNWFKFRDRQKN